MRIAFVVLMGVHGLIHLLGPTKAFGWAQVPQLHSPISALGGALWLVAAILLIGSAIGLALGAPWWWWLGLPGMALSQVLITQSWSDARFGTLANLVIAIPLGLLLVDARPSSFRSRFAHDRDALLARPGRPVPVVTEADLASLPPPFADVSATRRRGRPAARSQPACALQGADAEQRDVAVDAGNRHAVRVLCSAGAPVLHERHARRCAD